MSTATNGTSAAMSAITTTLHVASLNRTGIRSARPLPLLPGFTTGFSLLLPAVVKDDAGGLSGHAACTASPQSPRLWPNALAGNRRSARGTSPFRKLYDTLSATSPRCRNAGTAPMSRLSCSLSRSSVGIPAV
jgi:hypothetical protein